MRLPNQVKFTAILLFATLASHSYFAYFSLYFCDF
uniref:Uncharacterized protein n=1 Tax=Rhizophora mucronata TaxID=61149 RepID=A0A2P2PAG3_RHIMU